MACQVSLSMGFARQEYWSGLPFPSPGDLPDPEIKPGSPTLQADSLASESPGKPLPLTWREPNPTGIYYVDELQNTPLPRLGLRGPVGARDEWEGLLGSGNPCLLPGGNQIPLESIMLMNCKTLLYQDWV